MAAVRHDPTRHRFVVALDGRDAGFTRYLERGAQRIFVHTEIDPGWEGRGLASELIRGALTATREAGLRIVAVCPFVARYVRDHREWDDIVDTMPEHPRELL